MSDSQVTKDTLAQYEKQYETNEGADEAPPNQDHGVPLEITPSRIPGLSQVLTRTLSKVRTADTIPLTPPPDGGLRAWVTVALAHCVMFNVWGFLNSFGLFETYYVNVMKIGGQSQVAWIGSIQMFIIFSVGPFSGRALDAGYFKLIFCIGSTIIIIGLFMMSLCTHYWQLLLAQGICVGFGYGLVFVPTIALTSTYFLNRRTTALGIVTSGAGTGGLVFPAIAERMLPTAGFGWTVRTVALVQTVVLITVAIFMKPRIPPRKSGPLVEWSAFKEAPFSLYLTGSFFWFWSVYVGFFFIGSYARDVLHASQSTSIALLMAMNGVGVIGRAGFGMLADAYLGPLNVMITAVFIAGVLSFVWIAVDSVTGIWVFTIFYGLVLASLQGLYPAVLTSLTTNPKKTGTRAGMGFGVIAWAGLSGTPIAGALIQRENGSYLGCQIFAGVSMFVSVFFLTWCRWTRVKWQLKVKV